MNKDKNFVRDDQINFTILVVEDDISWQKAFKRFLGDEPFTISVTSNYQNTLNLIETQSFDLAILDIHLSESDDNNTDGLRIARKLRLKDERIKIIIVSGTDDPSGYLSSMNFVPQYILKKQNLDPDDFVKKIYAALAQR